MTGWIGCALTTEWVCAGPCRVQCLRPHGAFSSRLPSLPHTIPVLLKKATDEPSPIRPRRLLPLRRRRRPQADRRPHPRARLDDARPVAEGPGRGEGCEDSGLAWYVFFFLSFSVYVVLKFGAVLRDGGLMAVGRLSSGRGKERRGGGRANACSGTVVDCPEAEATYVITSGGIRDPDKA